MEKITSIKWATSCVAFLFFAVGCDPPFFSKQRLGADTYQYRLQAVEANGKLITLSGKINSPSTICLYV